jgi:hypothetical protein
MGLLPRSRGISSRLISKVRDGSGFWIVLWQWGEPMDDEDGKRVRDAWNQRSIPIILRRSQGQLRLRVPVKSIDGLWIGTTRAWLRSNRHHLPVWDYTSKHWEVPARWFNNLVEQLLKQYKLLYIIQPHREQEVCASQCWNAEGHDCQCSCLGENHGQGKMGHWLEISDTFATRWGDTKMACRLMKIR